MIPFMAKRGKFGLPEPDKFGNYWLGPEYSEPAIFKSLRKGHEGKFFVCDSEKNTFLHPTLYGPQVDGMGNEVVGPDGQIKMIVIEPAGVTYYNSPEEALDALREAGALPRG